MLTGPVFIKFGTPGGNAASALAGTNFGDFLTQVKPEAPAAVVLSGINREFSGRPRSGHGVTLTGVSEDMKAGTLWRWLWDHAGERDVPVLWSPLADGDVYFQGVIGVVPDPISGAGQANQHGTFDVRLPLNARPTIVAKPA